MLILKLVLLLLYLVILVLAYRCVDYINWNDAYNVATAIDPLSLSLQQLRWLLHLRGVSYHKAIEKKDLTDLVSTSGVVTKDEVDFAEMMDHSSPDVTMFSEMEDFDASLSESEDVWLVQVVAETNAPVISSYEWNKLKKRSRMIGVRIGEISCKASPVLCESRSLLTSQLLLNYHYDNGKRGIHKKHFITRPINSAAAFHWMSSIFEDVLDDFGWPSAESSDEVPASIQVLYVSTGSVLPALLVPLKLKFQKQVKFGKALSTDAKKLNKLTRLNGKESSALVYIRARKYDVFYGDFRGEIFSFPHLHAHLRFLNPDINFYFTWSVYICNFLSALSFLTTTGPLFSRLVAVIKSIVGYNFVLLGAWLIASGCKLEVSSAIAARAWTFIYSPANRQVVSLLVMDFARLRQCFLPALAGFILFFWTCMFALRRFNMISDEQGETVSGLSDLLLNDPPNPASNDISQRWIERLATPELWLQPLVPPQYIEDLPVWEYTGPCERSSDESDADRNASPYRTASPSPNRQVTDSQQQCRVRGRSFFGHSTQQATSRLTQGLIRSIRSCLRGRSPRVRKTTGPPEGMRQDSSCSVCLEHYKCRSIVCGLPCGHVFHHACILAWLDSDKHCCPVCRWPSYRPKNA